jgi:hypothetical protein
LVTYILGAGASVHAGYPLTDGLGKMLVSWIANNPTNVNQLYGSSLLDLNRLYGDLGDLERVLTELDEGTPGSRASTMTQTARNKTRQDMRVMISELFRALRSDTARLYRRIARERIQPGDTTITFNYDVALERELSDTGLWHVSDGYTFNVLGNDAPHSKVRVLKLHGSSNWLDVFFNGHQGLFQAGSDSLGTRPVIFPAELTFLGCDSSARDSLAPVQRAAALPAIIMPIRTKRFYQRTTFGDERLEFWDHLWSQAALALSASEKVVIVGYSMPAADQRARELIFRNTNRAALVEVYSGRSTAAIRDLFATHGIKRISESTGRHFEDYLERHD